MIWIYSDTDEEEYEEESFCLYKSQDDIYPMQSVYRLGIDINEKWKAHGWDNSFMDSIGNIKEISDNPYFLMHLSQVKFKNKLEFLVDEFKVSFPIHQSFDHLSIKYKTYYCGR